MAWSRVPDRNPDSAPQRTQCQDRRPSMRTVERPRSPHSGQTKPSGQRACNSALRRPTRCCSGRRKRSGPCRVRIGCCPGASQALRLWIGSVACRCGRFGPRARQLSPNAHDSAQCTPFRQARPLDPGGLTLSGPQGSRSVALRQANGVGTALRLSKLDDGAGELKVYEPQPRPILCRLQPLPVGAQLLLVRDSHPRGRNEDSPTVLAPDLLSFTWLRLCLAQQHWLPEEPPIEFLMAKGSWQ